MSPRGNITASPTLVHNICGDHWQNSGIVKLFPSPFGSGQPVIPTARAVTVARIASPISVDRTYQQAFLAGLKSQFEEETKLVKSGDIISVPINSDRRTVNGTDLSTSINLSVIPPYLQNILMNGS